MESTTHIQIVDETVCISFYGNPLWEDMNPFNPFPSMSK